MEPRIIRCGTIPVTANDITFRRTTKIATVSFLSCIRPARRGCSRPLTVAGKMPLVLFLVLLNSAAWATCILAPIYLVSGKIRGHSHLLYWVPSLVCCVYIWDTYLEGQLAFCLSAALLGMMVCLQSRREVAGGFLLALAAGFKAFPILALPYLIYRRHWKALISTGIFLFLFVFVLPAFYRGPRGAVDDLKSWNAGMMSPNTPEKMGATSRVPKLYLAEWIAAGGGAPLAASGLGRHG